MLTCSSCRSRSARGSPKTTGSPSIFLRFVLCLGLAGLSLANPNNLPAAEETGAALASRQIERGRPFWLLDTLGNLLSIPKKLLLLNAKVDNHRVSSHTEEVLRNFLASDPETTRDVKVRINQWTPVGEFKRLVQNKRIEWYFRVFPGIPTTLFSSVTGRVLGGDHYNPYTNTIHLFSDDPAIALHEAGHAVDFAKQAQPGYYAIGRILPPVELAQEQTATDIAIQHLKEQKDREGELRAYQTLYPAFGTYGGERAGLPYGSYLGAGAGHILGFWQRHERRLGYQALDEARVQDYVVTETELSRVLLSQQEKTRRTLLRSLQNKVDK